MVLTVIWELGVYSLQYYVGGGVLMQIGEIFLYGCIHITLASLFYSFALVNRVDYPQTRLNGVETDTDIRNMLYKVSYAPAVT